MLVVASMPGMPSLPKCRSSETSSLDLGTRTCSGAWANCSLNYGNLLRFLSLAVQQYSAVLVPNATNWPPREGEEIATPSRDVRSADHMLVSSSHRSMQYFSSVYLASGIVSWYSVQFYTRWITHLLIIRNLFLIFVYLCLFPISIIIYKLIPNYF